VQNSKLEEQREESDVAKYIDIIINNKWLVAICLIISILVGVAYALLAKPIYESNLLVQVESGQSGFQGLLGPAADLLEVKTAASAEMEIIRSRLVVGQAVDNLRLYLEAEPEYFPIFGRWVAKRRGGLSSPGIFGIGGYVWGREDISLDLLEVPPSLIGKRLRVVVTEEGAYELSGEGIPERLRGQVGKEISFETKDGPIQIKISKLDGKPGATFYVSRFSRLRTVENLQNRLTISEKGRQSGVLGVRLEGADPHLLAKILNEIGYQYIRQNVERRSADAEKSLAFLDEQLPLIKKQLDTAENRFNQLRNRRGTVNLGEEAKALLQQLVAAQTEHFALLQRRQELRARFTAEHPSIRTIDQQINQLAAVSKKLTEQIKDLPALEQEIVRLSRDVEVNTQLYTTLLNNAQQLKLVKAGRIGNARLIDSAEVPEVPIKPNRQLVMTIAAILGIIIGISAAVGRDMVFGGIKDPQEIENKLGLTVYSTIPHSEKQQLITKQVAAKEYVAGPLATVFGYDPAVEAIRSLRTALQFATLEARNNIILITGATPSVGKSFVSSNLAAVLATTGKRVLLIDADLRKGYLNQYFGLPRENGLSEILAGTVDWEKVVHKEVTSNLAFIATGVLPPNPAELLLGERAATILEEVSAKYDYVLIDTAPVLAASDAGILANVVGTMFLVARAERSTLGEIEESIRRLRLTAAPLKGVIFNGVGRSSNLAARKYGGYRYAYYAYAPEGYDNNTPTRKS